MDVRSGGVGGLFIARTYGIPLEEETPGRYDAEREANARLIAAAPDLLDALKAHDAYMAAQFSGPDSDALHPNAAANWRTIRAAIAKAEGTGA